MVRSRTQLAEKAGAPASVAECQMQKMRSNSQRGHLSSDEPWPVQRHCPRDKNPTVLAKSCDRIPPPIQTRRIPTITE